MRVPIDALSVSKTDANAAKTGLELRVSYKYFVRPGGFDDGRGVLPDVEVPASQALQWVLSHVR